MLKLCEAPSLLELRLIASYLESEGIEIEILNEHQGGSPVVPHGGLSVWAELWVKNSRKFERAEKLLARYRQEQSRECTGEWTCTACNEANPDSFEQCWHCGAPGESTT